MIRSFKIYFSYLRKITKVTIKVVMYVHLPIFPPVRPFISSRGHLGFHFTNFHEMFMYLWIFLNSVENIQVS